MKFVPMGIFLAVFPTYIIYLVSLFQYCIDHVRVIQFMINKADGFGCLLFLYNKFNILY